MRFVPDAVGFLFLMCCHSQSKSFLRSFLLNAKFVSLYRSKECANVTKEIKYATKILKNFAACGWGADRVPRENRYFAGTSALTKPGLTIMNTPCVLLVASPSCGSAPTLFLPLTSSELRPTTSKITCFNPMTHAR